MVSALNGSAFTQTRLGSLRSAFTRTPYRRSQLNLRRRDLGSRINRAIVGRKFLVDSSRTEGGTGALAAAQAAVVQARPEADGRRRRTQGCGGRQQRTAAI